jgi:2-polyprenyl-3-methyl-5-hydroxy-6-metoxy-1,4-benzoquinol methylase
MKSTRDLNAYVDSYRSMPFEPTQIEFRKKMVLEQVRKLKPKSILEVGCGERPLFLDIDLRPKFTVVEPARQFFENAIRYSEKFSNVTILNDFIENIDFGNQKFDLIIDDGLHIPFANLSVIISSLRYVKKNGYLIIEDIPFGNKYIWEVIGYILHDKYKNFIVKSKKCFVFIIKN